MKRQRVESFDLERFALTGGPAQGVLAQFTIAKNKPGDQRPTHIAKTENTTMTPEQEKALNDQVAKSKLDFEALAKSKERSDKIVALATDARAIFDKLPAEKQDGFLALDAASQTREVAKSKDENGVVYECKALAKSFRKNDDPVMIAMARKLDEQGEEIAKANELREEAILKSRAAESFEHLALTPDEKVGLLRMLDGGVCKSTDIRKSIAKKLETMDEGFSKAFDRSGFGGEDEATDGPAAELQKLVDEHVAKAGVSQGAATLFVAKTAKGRALYAKINDDARNGEVAR